MNGNAICEECLQVAEKMSLCMDKTDEAERVWGVVRPVREVFGNNSRCYVVTSLRFLVVTLEDGAVDVEAGRLYPDESGPLLPDLLIAYKIEKSIAWTEVRVIVFGGAINGTLSIAVGSRAEQFRIDSQSWTALTSLVDRVRAILTPWNPEVVASVTAGQVGSWSRGLILCGALSLVFRDTLDPVWGCTLIALGAVSLKFRRAEFLIVFGMALMWAGLTNLLGLIVNNVSGFLSILQFSFGASLFRLYGQLRLQDRRSNPDRPYPPADGFGIASLIIAIIVVLLSMFLGAVIVIGIAGISISVVESAANLVFQIIGNLGAVSAGLGIGALRGGTRNSVMAWTGIVVGGVAILAVLGLAAMTMAHP